jgi:hypothetical protein
MPTTELILAQKTIFHHFPDFEDFYNEARKAVEKVNLIADNEEEALWYVYAYCVYDKWKLNVHYNQAEVFLSKLWAGMVAKFFTLQKRERLWKNIFAHISLELNKLVELKSTEYTRDDRTKYLDANRISNGDFDRTITGNTFEQGEERTARRTTASEKPLQTSNLLTGNFGNIKDRAKWLSGEEIEDSGYIGVEKDKDGNIVLGEDGKPNKVIYPNWNKRTGKNRNKDTSQKHDKTREDSKETDRGTIDKTIYSQEQPVLIQQLARIIPSYSLVESDLEDFTDFSHLFHTVYLGGGEFIFNSNTWEWDYLTREEIKAQEEEKTGKTKLPRIKETDADLSFDEWQELYNEQEVAIMPTWYLERIYRYKKRIEKKGNKDETDQARLEICDTLLDTYYREPYWPPLNEFEKIMGTPPEWEGRVIGFKEFKSTWYEALQTASHFRKQGVRLPQIFYVLLGKPGVGKSEISQRLAQALKRPIQIINVGGMEDGGELEGKRATLQSANYGKMMEAFTERSFLAEITIDDLKQEIHEIKTRKETINAGTDNQQVIEVARKTETITEWEEERIEKLQDEIQEWEEDNARRIKEGKEPKLIKKKAYRSRSPVILLDEFEKASREDILNVIGKITDRELNYTFLDKYFNFNLDISQAVILLTANYLERVPQFVQDRGEPVNIELLSYQQRKKILEIISTIYCRTYGIAHLRKVISDKFLEMCITETWGIRGGMNNLQKVMLFLVGLEVKKISSELTDLADYADIYETPMEDYKKKESGVIKLTYQIGGKELNLTLTKRIGIEKRTIKDPDDPLGEKEKVLKEIITGTDIETGQRFIEDWPEEYWWGTEPIREL